MDVDVSFVDAILYLGLFLIFLLISVGILIYVTTSPHPDDRQYGSEKFFRVPDTKGILGPQVRPFPSLKDVATVNLSVVVPAFDEVKRLPPMLDECIDFLEKRLQSDPLARYEIIIVDDGSRDATTELGIKYSAKWGTDKIRVLTLAENRGKGGAVRLGMLKCRGKQLLFADADGATKFSDFIKLERCLLRMAPDFESDAAIVVGSRAHLEKESIATRSFFRTVLMYGFHLLVWLFCVRQIRDTQCGFKLMTRAAARLCFPNLHIHRWAFDVELLFIAESIEIPIEEVSVVWTEIDGSKIVPFWSWLQMGRDLLLLWFRYTVGIWRIDLKRKID